MSSEKKGFNVEFDPSKAELATGLKGVFEGTITEANIELSEPKQLEPNAKGEVEATSEQWQIVVKILSPKYQKEQIHWLPFATKEGVGVKGIGSKWMNWQQQMVDLNVPDLNMTGGSPEEKMNNYAKSLLGLKFDFEEVADYPQGVSSRDYLNGRKAGRIPPSPVNKTTKRMLLPIVYKGRVAIAASGGFATTKVGSDYK